jgi:hypothetical protein
MKKMRDCLRCAIHNLLKRSQVPVGQGVASPETLPMAVRQTTTFPLPPTPSVPSRSQLRATGLEPSTTGNHNGWPLLGANMHALPLRTPRTGGSHHSLKASCNFSRPIVSTDLQLLTGHAFAGEYTARFRSWCHDSLHCQCGESLQTTHHVIAARPYSRRPGQSMS